MSQDIVPLGPEGYGTVASHVPLNFECFSARGNEKQQEISFHRHLRMFEDGSF